LISLALCVALLHPDYLELAPENWFATRELTVSFKCERQGLNAFVRTPYEEFKAQLDKTIPVFIETD
jgi:hypothetical protein